MSAGERVVLVVDDDPGIRSQMRWCFDGCTVVEAGDRREALARLRRHEPRVVTLDLGLPPDPGGASEGLATLQEILAAAPGTRVIVITGQEDRSHAVSAIGLGAHDFYQKPLDPDLLRVIVERAFRLDDLERENRRLIEGATVTPLSEIIGASAAIDRVRYMVEKVAPALATTCLLGESGTGKELVARALHRLSPRAEQRFVALNCAAIPDTLLESELFGYEKGAFTGAHQQTPGRIEHAQGGTLFLDEIGDLPSHLQSKLLRFLQERTVERIGARHEIPVDVRVIAATNRDLDCLMAEGSFREDLYYRLCEVIIRIPPLREREGDAGIIARHLLARLATEQRRGLTTLTTDAIDAIDDYPWPGNIRELANRLTRGVIMADGPAITAAELELAPAADRGLPLNLRTVRDGAERHALERALEHGDGNLSRTAELLGISRPTLYALLDKHDLRPARGDPEPRAAGP